jgi:hypothetical protein
MGVVFKARDTERGTLVALKTLHNCPASSRRRIPAKVSKNSARRAGVRRDHGLDG